jgi:hypothetical protein
MSAPRRAPPALSSGGLGEQQVQGGQVRQDPVLADVGVLELAMAAPAGGGVAVAAPVGGLAVGLRRFRLPPAATADQQAGQEVPALARRSQALIWDGPRAALMSCAAMKSASLTSSRRL